MEFWSKLAAHLHSGEPAFLGLVADNTAHSPGTRGAKMFVRPAGTTEGTIGGGVMEGDLIATAKRALESGAFEATHQTLYHRKKGKGRKSGLGCAGHQTNVYALLEPERDLEVVSEAARRVEADEAGLLQIGPAGMRLVDEGVIGRERAPVRLVDDADIWRYEEQLLNWKRVAIIGGGHCGWALSRVLSNLGYTVSVFETRAEVFTFVNNQHARRRVVVPDYADVGAQIAHPELTHVVVMTRAQPGDVRALLGTIERPYPYIGVMGSPAKLAMIRRDLVAEGADARLLDGLHAPIGLDMTSNTPEEIAISIAAELLREREALFPHARPSRPTPPEAAD